MTQIIKSINPIYLEQILDQFLYGNTAKLVEYKPEYPLNIYVKDDDSVTFEIAASGANTEDVEVKAKGQNLIINIEQDTDEENSEENKEYICRSLVKRSFNREYNLPDRLDLDKADVELKNGILKINIPVKAESKITTKTLTIK